MRNLPWQHNEEWQVSQTMNNTVCKHCQVSHLLWQNFRISFKTNPEQWRRHVSVLVVALILIVFISDAFWGQNSTKSQGQNLPLRRCYPNIHKQNIWYEKKSIQISTKYIWLLTKSLGYNQWQWSYYDNVYL